MSERTHTVELTDAEVRVLSRALGREYETRRSIATDLPLHTPERYEALEAAHQWRARQIEVLSLLIQTMTPVEAPDA